MKLFLALVVGIIFGSIVNMGFIMLSAVVVPPPNGIDTTNMDGLLEAMPLMQPKHFVMPFLGHAIGTLVGAWLAAQIAPSNKLSLSMAIGAWFLIGGVYMIYLVPTPVWFVIVDLALAYIPMAYMGYALAKRHKQNATSD